MRLNILHVDISFAFTKKNLSFSFIIYLGLRNFNLWVHIYFF